MTALTLSETLSRVMTSCGGTSIATVWRLTFTMRSIIGTSSTSPGPLPCPPGLRMARVLRPSLKMTARSYSRRMRANELTTKSAKTSRTTASRDSNVPITRLLWRRLDDLECQPLDRDHPYRLALSDRARVRAGPPLLAQHAHLALGLERGARDAHETDQAGRAGHRPPAERLDAGRERDDEHPRGEG